GCAGGVLPRGPAHRECARQVGKAGSWLTGNQESPLLLIEDGFQSQPCFQPAPLDRCPRNTEKESGFTLLQPFVPNQLNNLSFLLWQGFHLFVELCPGF